LERVSTSESKTPQSPPSGAPWTRFDLWLQRPRSAAMVVLWLSLYLVL